MTKITYEHIKPACNFMKTYQGRGVGGKKSRQSAAGRLPEVGKNSVRLNVDQHAGAEDNCSHETCQITLTLFSLDTRVTANLRLICHLLV